MTKKRYDFITGIEADKKTPPKKKYQVYEAELGISRATVIIPAEKTAQFELAAAAAQPTTKAQLTELAAKFGGSIE